MKITRSQLRKLISEALEIHIAPEDLELMPPEEAYGEGCYEDLGHKCDLDETPNDGSYGKWASTRALGAIINEVPLEEDAPPGDDCEKFVKSLKGKVDNPYAIAWSKYNKNKKC